MSHHTFCRDMENLKKMFIAQIRWNGKGLESSSLDMQPDLEEFKDHW
jgi:hypothetical protein